LIKEEVKESPKSKKCSAAKKFKNDESSSPLKQKKAADLTE
jgi:hypothetical protein